MPGFSLTLFRGRGGALPMPAARNTPSTATNPPGAPDDLPKKIEADYLCAKKTKPFVVAFERGNRAGSPYFIEAIRYGYAAEGSAAETAAFVSIPATRLNFQRFQCPHCRSANFVRCGTCGRLVCQGRTKDGIFRCADDCGAEGRIEGALEAIGGQENMRAPGAMLPGSTATKLLSASRHPTGGALPKRGG